MEQIVDSFGIDPKIFLAEIVNFIIVLGILYYFVFRRISTMLDERRGTIEKGLSDAEEAQKALESAEAEKKEILHQAGEEATAEIKAAVETAKQREAEIVDQANKRSEDIVRDAQAKGEELKQKLVDSSQQDIAKMIVLGAEQVLKTK